MNELTMPSEPLEAFHSWLKEAMDAGIEEANAFCLCTIAPGYAQGRYLLLKGVDSAGFRFFTNYGSHKAVQLEAQAGACMVFWWGALRRQIRVTGRVAKLLAPESDAYFASRPRESQLAAWASVQSAEVSGRQELEERLSGVRERFEGKPVPRPEFWGGFRLVPERIEFWQGRSNRFHDRLVYERGGQGWTQSRLMP